MEIGELEQTTNSERKNQEIDIGGSPGGSGLVGPPNVVRSVVRSPKGRRLLTPTKADGDAYFSSGAY